jgi:hypothetical protein
LSTRFLHGGIWSRLTRLAKRKPAFVAVAYCAEKASQLLPLSKGSVLVVDMSERAVRSGQTDPREIKKFLKRGVEVHSVENLHAKVFVLDDCAVVGSTNISRRSANHLQEAAIESTSPSVVAACRKFVESLRGEPVDREYADEMAKLYLPPKIPGDKKRRRKRVPKHEARTPAHKPVWAVALTTDAVWDDDDHKQDALARPSVHKQIDDQLECLDRFTWKGPPLYSWLDVGDLVLQVTDDVGGTFVSPASRVVKVRRYRVKNEKRLMAFLATPSWTRRKRRQRVMKLLGSHGKALVKLRSARLVRDGAAVHALLNLWPSRPSR